MGVLKAEKPMIPKETIWPAIVVTPTTDPSTLRPFTKNRAQTTAYPSVYGRKGPLVAVLEIHKPTFESGVDVRDDDGQTVAVAPFGLGSDGVSELLHALLPGPSTTSLEVIPEEIEADTTNCCVHQTGFGRMQTQTLLCGQSVHEGKGSFCFFITAAQNDKVIGVANHEEAGTCHRNIDRVQIQVREQRTDHSALGCSFLGTPQGQVLHNVLLEESLNQGHHSAICNVASHVVEERLVRDSVEVGFKISINNMNIAFLKKLLNFPESILTSATWAKTLTALDKFLLKDRLDHKPKGRLDYAIYYTGDT